VKVTRFDPAGSLIIVRGWATGPTRQTDVRLAIDTAAAETILTPEVIDRLGYSPRHGESFTKIRSAVAEEPGYMLRIDRLRALGHELTDFRVDVHDLPEGYGIEGLLGLSFLRQFNYEVRSVEGRIRVERAQP
jgi:predicted aspartyl protease